MPRQTVRVCSSLGKDGRAKKEVSGAAPGGGKGNLQSGDGVTIVNMPTEIDEDGTIRMVIEVIENE